jgi:hypothetical protein
MIRGQDGALPRATPLPCNTREPQPPRQKLGKLAAKGRAAWQKRCAPPGPRRHKRLTFLRRSSASTDTGCHPQPSETVGQGDLDGPKGIASRLSIAVHGGWRGAATERRLAQRPEKIWGGTERERLGRLIRSPESSRSLLCLFLCGRRLRLSALTSIKLKLCALPWVPPFSIYSCTSFLCLRRYSIPRLWTDVRPFVLGLLT